MFKRDFEIKFKWFEPFKVRKVLSRYELKKKGIKGYVFISVILTVLFMFQWYLAKQNPQKNPPNFMGALSIAVSCSAVLGLFLYFIFRYLPCVVNVSNKGISRQQGQNVIFFKYESILSIIIDKVKIGNTELPIMLIKSCTTNSDVMIGIGKKINQEELVEYLKTKVKAVEVNT
jgi:hypothetical protein